MNESEQNDIDLAAMLDELDYLAPVEEKREHKPRECVKAIHNWPGGKSKNKHLILPHIPKMRGYGEPFGGAMSILLAREASALEVYNDRYGAVTDLYKIIRNYDAMQKLKDRLELTVHSREEFYHCLDTYEKEPDIIERVARWYYTVCYSFAAKGQTFGRSVKAPNCMSGKIQEQLPNFDLVHHRIKKVLIENRDYRDLLKDFDDYNMVWYCDPPYLGATSTHYAHEFTVQDHQDLLNLIFTLKGYVVMSGYPNDLYDRMPWDDRHSWKQACSAEGAVHNEHNNLAGRAGLSERGEVTECLWIKYNH